MQQDTFWRRFWQILGGCALIYTLSVAMLLYVRTENDTARAEAVGVFYNPDNPFEKQAPSIAPKAGAYLYRDSLPPETYTWESGARTDWRNTAQRAEGNYSARVTFTEQYGTVGVNNLSIDVSEYNSLLLAVYPLTPGALYVELYDQHGKGMGAQSLGWYTKQGALALGQWNVIAIPLENLAANAQYISEFSLSADEPGAIFLDDMRFDTAIFPHNRWEAQEDTENSLEN